MARSIKDFTELTDAEIAPFAYFIFRENGELPGHELEHWLEAEAQLIADRRADLGLECDLELLHRNGR